MKTRVRLFVQAVTHRTRWKFLLWTKCLNRNTFEPMEIQEIKQLELTLFLLTCKNCKKFDDAIVENLKERMRKTVNKLRLEKI